MHNCEGNCWLDQVVYYCKECGKGNLCDVCHQHDSPRGDCPDCKRCEACEAEDTRTP
jgi:hypothetical protein